MAKISKIAPIVSDPKTVYLRLYNQGKFIETFQLKKGSTLVGRDPSNQIVIKSTFVSRHHFVIEVLDNGMVYIQDLKSRNGTYLNRERVSKTKLNHKDRVICGPFEFVFNQPHFNVSTAKTDRDSLTALELTQKDTQDAEGKTGKKTKKSSDSLENDPSSSVSLSIEYLDNHDIDLPTMITGLESAKGSNATREADMSVMPDRVVPLQKTSKLKVMMMILGMIGFSAILAYGMFTFMQKNAAKLPLSMKNAQNVPSDEDSADVNPKKVNKTQQKTIKTSSRGVKKSAAQKSSKSSNQKSFKVGDILGNLGDEEIDFSALNNLSENTSRGRQNIAKAMGKATLSVDVEPPKYKGSIFSFGKKKAQEEVSVDSAREAVNYQKSIKDQLGFVQSCFINYAKNPERPGTISLELSISDSGRVERQTINAQHFKNAKLDECLKNGTRDIVADSKPPWEGFTANYRFKFAGMNTKSFDT